MLHELALLCLTLMTGSEVCIALFINPVLRRMSEAEQIPFLSTAARHLGFAMPFWYIASLALTLADAIVGHRAGAGWLNHAAIATLIEVLALALTIGFLVPINNRLGKLKPNDRGWTRQAIAWDHGHQTRVVMLLIAVATLAF